MIAKIRIRSGDCPQLYYFDGWVWKCALDKGHKTGHDFFIKLRRKGAST